MGYRQELHYSPRWQLSPWTYHSVLHASQCFNSQNCSPTPDCQCSCRFFPTCKRTFLHVHVCFWTQNEEITSTHAHKNHYEGASSPRVRPTCAVAHTLWVVFTDFGPSRRPGLTCLCWLLSPDWLQVSWSTPPLVMWSWGWVGQRRWEGSWAGSWRCRRRRWWTSWCRRSSCRNLGSREKRQSRHISRKLQEALSQLCIRSNSLYSKSSVSLSIVLTCLYFNKMQAVEMSVFPQYNGNINFIKFAFYQDIYWDELYLQFD